MRKHWRWRRVPSVTAAEYYSVCMRVNISLSSGADFTAEITEERVVERIETIRVPAGEFETYKITSAARIKSKDLKGGAYTGKEESAWWVALVSGQLTTVKISYRNSFGDKFSLELITATYK